MADIDQFASALYSYIKEHDKCSLEERHNKYVEFQNTIQHLNCNDFRFFYYRAHYLNSMDQINEAKCNIDKSIQLTNTIDKSIPAIKENGIFLFAPSANNTSMLLLVELPHIRNQISNVYNCAGEIYAKIGDVVTSTKYYQISMYYNSFLKSEFDTQKKINLFSFRRFNEHSLSDLINNTITVSPSTKMNDPFDSIINLWGNENRLINQCHEIKHIRPMCESFNSYRIRAFCFGKGNAPIKNILMWSHYAAEHTGFCVKYKLSKHFIHQEENEHYEHMYLKRMIYTNKKLDILTPSIDSNLAFATKKADWKYENEVRLIVYNPNKKDLFYGIELDDESSIEAIFFGYRCSDVTINTIKNIFINKCVKLPKFYKIVLDDNDIYNLKYSKV